MAKKKKRNKPPAGQRQPVSVTTEDTGDWVEVDASGAFPAGEDKIEVLLDIVLGIDHVPNPTIGYAQIRFRAKGDADTFEQAVGTAGKTKLIYRDASGNYVRGGFTDTLLVPVDSLGKFEYFLRNTSSPARTILRISEVFTEVSVPSPIILLPEDARLPTADWPLLTKLFGTGFEDIVLRYSDTVDQKASWRVALGEFGAFKAAVHVIWHSDGGTLATFVKWTVGMYGAKDKESYDGTLVTDSVTDIMNALDKIHGPVVRSDDFAVELAANHTTVITIERDTSVADNLDHPADLVMALIEFSDE